MLLPRPQHFTVIPSLLGFYANQHNAARTVSVRAATATRTPFPRLGEANLAGLGGLRGLVDESMRVEDVNIRCVQVCCRSYPLACPSLLPGMCQAAPGLAAYAGEWFGF